MDTRVEDARYAQVLLQGIHASLYGKHDEVKALIGCGVFIKDAAAMLQKDEEAIKASVMPTK